MFTIMIADDHPAICFALTVLLEKEGTFKVLTSSGDRLLQQIRDVAPDLLVLDIELSNSDGMMILPRVKQMHPECKVLMLTGQPAHLYATRALQNGADGFIGKQTPLTAVVSLCHLLLEGYQCFPGTALQHHASRQEDAPLLNRLSDREMAVLRLMKAGKSLKEIAEMLMVSHKTISTYKARMLEKSGCPTLETLFEQLENGKDGE